MLVSINPDDIIVIKRVDDAGKTVAKEAYGLDEVVEVIVRDKTAETGETKYVGRINAVNRISGTIELDMSEKYRSNVSNIKFAIMLDMKAHVEEAPKQEDKPAQDQPKQEEKPSEQPKQDVPAEQPKQEDKPAQDTPAQDQPKADEPKQETPAQGEVKQEDKPAQEQPKQDQPKTEEPKQDVPAEQHVEEKKEEAPAEQPKQEDVKHEEKPAEQQPVEEKKEEVPQN